jgi:Protein of unknown function (DUF3616)
VTLDLDEAPGGATRTNLSVAARTGRWLWVASDEGSRLERLGRLEDGSFGEHASFALGDFFDLPAGPEGEADIEGMDFQDGWLWLVGSHSLKRRKPKREDTEAETVERLTRIESEVNRFLLGRIPLGEGPDGSPLPMRRTPDGREAGCLPFKSGGSVLTKALAGDEVVSPFLGVPAKENGFDIEGITVRGEHVFLGLRGPVLRGWALILELRLGAKRDGSLKLRKIVRPDGGKGRYRRRFLDLDGLGIRDLVLDGAGLLVLAGPTMDLDGPVTVWRWPDALADSEADAAPPSLLVPSARLERALDLPFGHGTDHAEGICRMELPSGEPGLLVVYDSPAPDRLHAGGRIEVDLFALP